MMLLRLAIASCAVVAACENTGAPVDREPAEPAVRAPTVRVAALTYDPDAYEGEPVRITGEVIEIVDPRVFVMAGGGVLWRPKVPVVASSPISANGRGLARKDDVIVLGVVHAHVTPELVRELALDATTRAAIGDGPVVLAWRIRRSGEYTSWFDGDPQPRGDLR